MKSMFRALVASVLLSLVTACATSTPKNPQQAILVARQNYTVAVEAAAYYGSLPTCGNVNPGVKVCANPPIVVQLKVAKDAAKPVIDQAEATVLDPKFDASKADAIVLSAQNALKALTSITEALHIDIPKK